MKSKLMHNLGLKIMAVLVSVVLWMMAVDINDPVLNKYINNVQVQLTNTGTLTGQGKTYRVVDNSDTIRVSVRAPKSAISAIDAQSVTAKADLSEITEDGRVPIELSLSSGLDVEKITSDRQYVQLQVENKKTRQLSIEVAKNGTLPDGYATGRIDMETNTLSISGPESAVNAVSRAVVDISLDNVTANVEIDATIRLLDADGSALEGYDSGNLFGDSVDRLVDFEKPVEELAGKEVRMELTMRDADLYSFRFEKTPAIC